MVRVIILNMKYFSLLISLCCLMLCSCKQDQPPRKLSFYYWRTTFSLSSRESQVLDKLEVKKLYVRFFDVGLSEHNAIPISKINFLTKPAVEVIPVVYIKNEVMLEKHVNLEKLSQQITSLVSQIQSYNDLPPTEIQLDCDWSLQSKERFLNLVDLVKKNSEILVSSTIRLHQIKFADKTGIPNVDYGVLMYYNMGQIGIDNKNSIYDRAIAQRYIPFINTYKLPVKLALPIYSWGIHIENNRVVELLPKLTVDDFESAHFEKVNEMFYKVIKSHFFKGAYLKTGDLVKFEKIKPNQLLEMIEDVEAHVAQPIDEIILYDLDQINFKNYENEVSLFKKISGMH